MNKRKLNHELIVEKQETSLVRNEKQRRPTTTREHPAYIKMCEETEK